MRVFVVVVAGALAFCVAGCVSVKPGSERVRFLSNPELVKGCTFITQETLALGGLDAIKPLEEITIRMKNKAAELGGTDVLTPGPKLTTPGPMTTITGDIYRCGS
ncbi:hypothetical protein [Chelatococcus asaccharovorans]|uniref:DUF4156 domain-containing protein n=1 Tax=Chelatococcus asaccharovorans TaxID=28210 RepID=A0A2V3U432_9HYPH|nr:hypothetical protein [Chelatococcus asaccharovorans]MBS7702699.1 hypothetical protein [Chelatococcus asaccharovorans]PXW56992.1 hypothetical protein C7450_10729 [Chelatococcus asaccharovorans]